MELGARWVVLRRVVTPQQDGADVPKIRNDVLEINNYFVMPQPQPMVLG